MERTWEENPRPREKPLPKYELLAGQDETSESSQGKTTDMIKDP